MPYPNELAPLTVTQGAIRFNTDSMKLEYYRGGPVGFGTTTQTGEWVNLTTDSPDIQTGGARGIFSTGRSTNVLEYITISTTGNSIDFGDTVQETSKEGFALASSTRGAFAGSYPAHSNIIEYVTISSTGNTADFGDLTVGRRSGGGCSNSTRGLFGGGITSPLVSSNVIDYVTIASIGNAVDFGDLLGLSTSEPGALSSSTRGVWGGGVVFPATANTNVIQFVTISTLGNAADFGDLTTSNISNRAGCSNSVRGLFGGGYAPGVYSNVIDYITIATLGNALDFGDLTQARQYLGACSSSTRGVWGGGGTPTAVNTIDYVSIMSAGNAIDFGDLLGTKNIVHACSNGHGGL